MTARANETAPIFLVGMERSGTSLIRAVLHKHSRIGIPVRGELQFFANWFDKYGDLSERENLETFAQAFFEKSKFRHLGIDPHAVLDRFKTTEPIYANFFTSVMREYASSHGKARWAEKSTSHIYHLPTILDLYPNAQYILIVRDPRDTYLSVKSAPWRRDKSVEPRQWALHWHHAYLNAVRILLNHPGQFYLYRHESFVGNPSAELKRVLEFLGEPFEPECLDIADLDWRQNSSFGDESSVISSSSVGRWRAHLSANALVAIEEACGDLMFLFDYERSSQSGPRPRGMLWKVAQRVINRHKSH